MPNGSRYGLDLGNILAQASNIKSARLNIRQKEKALDKQEAGEKLRTDIFAKKSNVLARKKYETELRQFGEENALGAIGKEAAPQAPEYEETLSEEEIGKLSVKAPEAASEIKETQQKAAQIESMTNYYMKKGQSKQEASLRATGYADDIDDFDKEYRTKTKFEQEQVRTNISQQGQMIQSMLEVAQKNPQQANQMYQDYISSKNEQIKKLLREGQTEIADKIQESIDKAPSTLIKQDGSFDAEFPMMSLSKMSTMMANAETWDAQAKSTLDIKKAQAKEELRQQRPDLKSGEYERLLRKANDPKTSPADKKRIEKRLTKMEQPTLSSLRVNVETVRDAQESLATSLGLDNPYALSTVDMRTLTPEQQAQANQTASIIVKGLGANAKQAEKKMGEFGAAQEQMQNALSAYEQVGDFRAADEMTKKYFSNYFGLSPEELKSTEAASAYQSMLNIKIKADSGSAVSGQEMVRNTLETASPYMTKAKIKLGIKNVAKRYIGELSSLKRVMGPVAFNLKYGAVLSNYEDIAKAVDTVKETKIDDLARLRESKPKQNRQTMYNQISTQRPNATPEQINAYLTSKGL